MGTVQDNISAMWVESGQLEHGISISRTTPPRHDFYVASPPEYNAARDEALNASNPPTPQNRADVRARLAPGGRAFWDNEMNDGTRDDWIKVAAEGPAA